MPLPAANRQTPRRKPGAARILWEWRPRAERDNVSPRRTPAGQTATQAGSTAPPASRVARRPTSPTNVTYTHTRGPARLTRGASCRRWPDGCSDLRCEFTSGDGTEACGLGPHRGQRRSGVFAAEYRPSGAHRLSEVSSSRSRSQREKCQHSRASQAGEVGRFPLFRLSLIDRSPVTLVASLGLGTPAPGLSLSRRMPRSETRGNLALIGGRTRSDEHVRQSANVLSTRLWKPLIELAPRSTPRWACRFFMCQWRHLWQIGGCV